MWQSVKSYLLSISVAYVLGSIFATQFTLSNLSDFSSNEKIDFLSLPDLEKWIFYKLFHLDANINDSYSNFDFHNVYKLIRNFCINDLSAFYFDVRKDSLYCDAKSSFRRMAVRSTLDTLFSFISAWLAPILCFTMEEVWLSRYGEDTESIHLQEFPSSNQEWGLGVDTIKWEKIRDVRKVITGAIEVERKNKKKLDLVLRFLQ